MSILTFPTFHKTILRGQRLMIKEFKFNLDNITEAAEKFLDEIGKNRIIFFEGEMGSGKTTFISEVCRLLGADDDFGSPTFSIVNEYADAHGNPIFHFDFYRIESPQEALDMGAEEYFYSGYLCLIEWPDRLGNLMPEEALTAKITIEPDGFRKLVLSKNL